LQQRIIKARKLGISGQQSHRLPVGRGRQVKPGRASAAESM